MKPRNVLVESPRKSEKTMDDSRVVAPLLTLSAESGVSSFFVLSFVLARLRDSARFFTRLSMGKPYVHALGCARQAIHHRHNMLRDDWSRIAREAGLSTATEQFAAELTLVSQNSAVRVMATATESATCHDVVVTSAPHWRDDFRHVSGWSLAVARRERDKLRRWDVEAGDTHGFPVIPLSVETQGR